MQPTREGAGAARAGRGLKARPSGTDEPAGARAGSRQVRARRGPGSQRAGHGDFGRARWSGLRGTRGVLIQNARAFSALSTYMIDFFEWGHFSKCEGGSVDEIEAG